MTRRVTAQPIIECWFRLIFSTTTNQFSRLTMLQLTSRRLPALRSFAIRAYSDSRIAGTTATSREFSKKEKAHEDQYIRQQEAAALEKLRKQLAKHQEELAKLTKEVEAAAAKSK